MVSRTKSSREEILIIHDDVQSANDVFDVDRLFSVEATEGAVKLYIEKIAVSVGGAAHGGSSGTRLGFVHINGVSDLASVKYAMLPIAFNHADKPQTMSAYYEFVLNKEISRGLSSYHLNFHLEDCWGMSEGVGIYLLAT